MEFACFASFTTGIVRLAAQGEDPALHPLNRQGKYHLQGPKSDWIASQLA